ncbi:MAG: 2-phospho-L-lactate transferase [Chloroflexi bacterium]|nr:2-phospho-L-lactate transferase [Chloroflexota bacterium]
MSPAPKKVLALAGGVGGAKLALGLARVLPPERLTVVVNTGDDDTFHGLHVCPDLDTVMYTLAGLADPERGWGIAGDTFWTLEALGRYGAPTWFKLGDLDLATHIRRTELLRQEWALSQITQELCRRLGVKQRVAPMTDQPVRTVVVTEEREMAFQEYFVRRGSQPRIRGVRFEGAPQAAPSPQFREALAGAEAVVFCPSNPVVSIGPILAVGGVRKAIATFRGPRLAVSPIVGGQALRGPAARMLAELGEEASCVGVARRYAGLCDVMVIDETDRHQAQRIRELGMDVAVANTVMRTDEDKEALARLVCELAGL